MLIRTKNAIDVNLDLREGSDDRTDEDELSEHQDEEDDLEDDEGESEPETTETTENESSVKSTRREVRRKPKEGKSEVTVPARRTAKKAQLGSDETMKKVKRKRLDSDLSESLSDAKLKTTSKRKVVSRPQAEEPPRGPLDL